LKPYRDPRLDTKQAKEEQAKKIKETFERLNRVANGG